MYNGDTDKKKNNNNPASILSPRFLILKTNLT